MTTDLAETVHGVGLNVVNPFHGFRNCCLTNSCQTDGQHQDDQYAQILPSDDERRTMNQLGQVQDGELAMPYHTPAPSMGAGSPMQRARATGTDKQTPSVDSTFFPPPSPDYMPPLRSANEGYIYDAAAQMGWTMQLDGAGQALIPAGFPTTDRTPIAPYPLADGSAEDQSSAFSSSSKQQSLQAFQSESSNSPDHVPQFSQASKRVTSVAVPEFVDESPDGFTYWQ